MDKKKGRGGKFKREVLGIKIEIRGKRVEN